MNNPITMAQSLKAVNDTLLFEAGSSTSAGVLTGTETIAISRGAGNLLQTTSQALATLTLSGLAPQRQSIPVLTAGQATYLTQGYSLGIVNVFVAGIRLNPSQYQALDGLNIVITDAGVLASLQVGMTVDIDASISIAVAGVATPASVQALLPTNQPTVGTLTGAELFSVTQGSGLFQSTLTKIAQWIIGTFQGFTQSGTGAVARTVQSKLQEFVSVMDFGADPTGTVPSTTAIQNAINTGLSVLIPPGTFLLTDQITCSTPGQMITGSGRFSSIFHVTSAFNLSAIAVFLVASGEEGPALSNFGIKFDQLAVASTGTRSSLVNYPPAIDVTGSPRFTITNLRISNAMNGIDMRGNNGGAFIDQLEMSAYGTGILIDGSIDTVRLSRYHFWPFDLTTNQQAIWNDGNTVGLSSGRMDWLLMDACVFLNAGVQANFFYGTRTGLVGFSVVEMTNCDFDTYGGLVVSAGQIQGSNCSFTVGLSSTSQWITQSGGMVSFINSLFETSAVQTVPLISVSANTTNAQQPTLLQLNNCQMLSVSHDNAFLAASTTGGADLEIVIADNWIQPAQNYSATNLLFSALGNSSVTFTGNKVIAQGTGVSTLLSLAVDNNNIVANNSFNGRSLVLPSPYKLTKVTGNSGIASAPGTIWDLDGSNNLLQIAAGASAAIAAGSGMVILVAQNAGNAVGVYTAGGGVTAQLSAANTWVAPTATPAAGKASFTYNGSAYAVYNNTGATLNVGIVSLRANTGN